MYFRVLIVVGGSCVARFDVSYKKAEMLLFPMEGQLPLERYRDATKMNQTAAILLVPNNEEFEVETSTRRFRLKFEMVQQNNEIEMYELAVHEIIEKQ